MSESFASPYLRAAESRRVDESRTRPSHGHHGGDCKIAGFQSADALSTAAGNARPYTAHSRVQRVGQTRRLRSEISDGACFQRCRLARALRNRDRSSNGGATGALLNFQCSIQLRQTFSHPRETNARSPAVAKPRQNFRGDPCAIINNGKDYMSGRASENNFYRLCARVPVNVGQRFLKHTEQCQLHFSWQTVADVVEMQAHL